MTSFWSKKVVETVVLVIVLALVVPHITVAQSPVYEINYQICDMVNYQLVLDRLKTAGWYWTGWMEQTPDGHILFSVGAWVMKAVNSVPIVIPNQQWLQMPQYGVWD